jgi:hypothetical protein
MGIFIGKKYIIICLKSCVRVYKTLKYIKYIKKNLLGLLFKRLKINKIGTKKWDAVEQIARNYGQNGCFYQKYG